MNYKIDMNAVMNREFGTTEEKMRAFEKALTAVLYMFEVGNITITEAQYKTIADKDKIYFKESK